MANYLLYRDRYTPWSSLATTKATEKERIPIKRGLPYFWITWFVWSCIVQRFVHGTCQFRLPRVGQYSSAAQSGYPTRGLPVWTPVRCPFPRRTQWDIQPCGIWTFGTCGNTYWRWKSGRTNLVTEQSWQVLWWTGVCNRRWRRLWRTCLAWWDRMRHQSLWCHASRCASCWACGWAVRCHRFRQWPRLPWTLGLGRWELTRGWSVRSQSTGRREDQWTEWECGNDGVWACCGRWHCTWRSRSSVRMVTGFGVRRVWNVWTCAGRQTPIRSQEREWPERREFCRGTLWEKCEEIGRKQRTEELWTLEKWITVGELRLENSSFIEVKQFQCA